MMKRKWLKLGMLVLSVVLVLISSNSLAAWGTRAEDDVFTDSKKIVMVGQAKNDGFLVFECVQGKISASYVESADVSQIQEGMLADLFIKVDDFPGIRLSALSVVRNRNAYAIRAEDPADSVKNILRNLRVGKHRFLLGFETEDNRRLSTSGNLDGSTEAVNKFINACDIELPATMPKKD